MCSIHPPWGGITFGQVLELYLHMPPLIHTFLPFVTKQHQLRILFEFCKQQGDPLGETFFFTLTHLCILHIIATTHPVYVFLHLSIICIILVLFQMWYPIFIVIGKVCSIKVFHSANKMHSLVSIGVRFILVTF